jgi:hypothetical protein
MNIAWLALTLAAASAASVPNTCSAGAQGTAARPAALPGQGVFHHPFLCAGEWDTRKPLDQSLFIVREVNPEGETVWEHTQADVPDIKMFNTQAANRLANRNTVICNWVAGNNRTDEWAGTVQVFEVTPDKKVVRALSSWKDPDLGPSTCIQLLDSFLTVSVEMGTPLQSVCRISPGGGALPAENDRSANIAR